MNEQQAVLDFFAKAENLPLALAVAEQVDKQRKQLNNNLWLALLQRLNALCSEHQLPWHIEITEDKNSPDNLVGLHGNLHTTQTLYLRPMIEQQNLGGDLRIYFGLMWSTAPSPEQLALPAISELKEALKKANFKTNESFLGWQWTSFHPRRKDFLLRYSEQPESVLDEIIKILQTLLVDFNEAIALANTALQHTPHGLSASLNQLRKELLD
ncbi:MAG: hypothetical protein HOO95_02060 [Gallionella sp.]|nr:hypothetical protein [Gallionella sp.]